VELKVTIEAFGTKHKNKIIKALEKNGFKPRQTHAQL
jgi:threonine dehydratase